MLIREDDRDQLNIVNDIENLLNFGEKLGLKINFTPGNGQIKFIVEYKEIWKFERRKIDGASNILVLTRKFLV